MKRSHSRRTYPADKMIPMLESEPIFICLSNGKTYVRTVTPGQRKFDKKFHTRKSRRFSRMIEHEEKAEY